MDCPRCEEVMIILEFRGVEIDYCPECGGIWLDEGELEILLEEKNEQERVLESLQASPEEPGSGCRCPVCRKPMEQVICSAGQKKVAIDRCRRMHGLWFDRGELDDVLRMGAIDRRGLTISLLKDMFSRAK